MDKQSQDRVYVGMMVDTLRRKKEILTFLYKKTKEQELFLKDDEIDPEKFQATIDEKGAKIEELNEIDEGFDALFKYVEREIKANRYAYQEEILLMQKLIGEVS